MYSLEKLARGIVERRWEQPHIIEISSDAEKYQNNCFADARKYHVITEKDPGRPRGCIYRSKRSKK